MLATHAVWWKTETFTLLGSIERKLDFVDAPQCEVRRLGAGENRLHDVGRQIGEPQNLPDVAFRETIRFCDLFRRVVSSVFKFAGPVIGERHGPN